MTRLRLDCCSRSCRPLKYSGRNVMQVLKKALVARFRQTGSRVAASSGQTSVLTSEVKGALAQDASEKLLDNLSAFNRTYDSPDERQSALANYAREHREKTRAPHPSVQFTELLRSGEGENLLALDGAAIMTLNAVASRNTAVAKLAVQSLGSDDASLPSPHLNFAVGSYNELYGDRDVGERSALAWMNSPRAPAQAYAWVASHQAKSGDYVGAIETLEFGRRRVGASAPFSAFSCRDGAGVWEPGACSRVHQGMSDGVWGRAAVGCIFGGLLSLRGCTLSACGSWGRSLGRMWLTKEVKELGFKLLRKK